MAIILKACGRCGGDLVPDRWDSLDGTLTCLQCGGSTPLEAVSRRRPAVATADTITSVLQQLRRAS
jgi:hypothetical protein